LVKYDHINGLHYICIVKKWFSILLVLLTMAGSFFPCCVDDDCTDASTTENNRHQDEHKEKGNCSPFFACGTCAAALVLRRLK
jgi:hypothetical protein